MARREGYVNVGQVINPADSLSRSLDGLSRLYAAQGGRQDARAAAEADRAESLRRFDITQDNAAAAALESKRRFDIGQGNVEASRLESRRRADLVEGRNAANFDHSSAERQAIKDLNAATNSFVAGDFDYSNVKIPEGIRKNIDKELKSISDGKNELIRYLSGEHNDELRDKSVKAYQDTILNPNAANRVDKGVYRTEALKDAEAHLATLSDPADRQAYIESIASNVYDGRTAKIADDLRTGKYLLANERQNAVINSLPANVREYVGRKNILGSLGDSVGGITREELIARERQATSDANKAGQAAANRRMQKFNQINSVRGGKPWTGADLKAAAKSISDLDIGWLDNSKAESAAATLVKEGVHPLAAINAVTASIERGTFGDSFFTESSNPKAFSELRSLARNLSANITGGSGGSVRSVGRVPEEFTPRADRTVSQIRDRMFRPTTSRLLSDYVARRQVPTAEAQSVTAPAASVEPVVEPAAPEQSDSLIPAERRAEILKLPQDLQSYVMDNEERVARSSEVGRLRRLLNTELPDPQAPVDSALDILNIRPDRNLPIGYRERLKNGNEVFVAAGRALGKKPSSVNRGDIETFLSSESGKAFTDRLESEAAAGVAEKARIQKRIDELTPNTGRVNDVPKPQAAAGNRGTRFTSLENYLSRQPSSTVNDYLRRNVQESKDILDNLPANRR